MPGKWTLEDIAEAVHRGRFPSDREATLFEHEDRAGRDYCLRIARSVAAMLSASPVPEKEGGEDEEAYHLGKRDGYEEAVADIDRLTGGDGEYRFCTDGDPERHTPDADAMKVRIVQRFTAPTDTGATVGGGAGELRVIAQTIRDHMLEAAHYDEPDGTFWTIGATVGDWRALLAALSNQEERRKPEAAETAHVWVPSMLGHGDVMCERCKITNREAAAVGLMNRCDAAPTPTVGGE